MFSKIHFNCYSGLKVKSEQASFVCLNPFQAPGCALFVGATAERAALGGQVAAKLSVSHFIDGVDKFIRALSNPSRISQEGNIDMLEAAFKNSNSAVYDFGHKLSAGGRMSASLVAILVNSGCIFAGRVGQPQAYLSRNGQAFPFFADKDTVQEYPTLGTNSLVSVEVASVPAESGDVISIFSEPVPKKEETELSNVIALLLPKFNCLDSEAGNPRGFSAKLDTASCERITDQIFDSEDLGFAAIIGIGPDVNFLGSSQAQS